MANTTIINLSSLLDLSGRLYESDDIHFILNSTVLSLMGKLKIFRSCVFILEDKKYRLILNKSKIHIDKMDFVNIDKLTLIQQNNSEFQELYAEGIRILIPLIHNNELIALICLGESITKDELSPEELEYINLVSNITSNAISNANNLKQLKNTKSKIEQRNQLLSAIFELGRDFSSFLSSDKIIKMLSLHLMGQMMVSRFAVFNIDSKRKYTSLINRFNVDFENCLLDSFSESLFAQRVSEMNFSEECNEFIKEQDIRIISPMVVQGKTVGLLVIGKKMNGEEFSDINLQFIQALGSTAALALENERLFKEEIEKKKLENELLFALEIQNNLLPKSSPKIQGYAVSGKTIPSRHVGGDFYDFLMLDETHLLVVIADVSGKGMPASLIMAHFQAALRILAPMHITLTDLILKLNLTIYQNTSPDKFVTAFIGILDCKTGAFYYINAGHNPPYLCNAQKEITELTEGGLILGFTDEPPLYSTGEVWMNKNDAIIMFTDGVTEAQNIAKEDYGEEKVKNLIAENIEKSTDDMITLLVDDVNEFSKGTHQFDDITLLVLKRCE